MPDACLAQEANMPPRKQPDADWSARFAWNPPVAPRSVLLAAHYPKSVHQDAVEPDAILSRVLKK